MSWGWVTRPRGVGWGMTWRMTWWGQIAWHWQAGKVGAWGRRELWWTVHGERVREAHAARGEKAARLGWGWAGENKGSRVGGTQVHLVWLLGDHAVHGIGAHHGEVRDRWLGQGRVGQDGEGAGVNGNFNGPVK